MHRRLNAFVQIGLGALTFLLFSSGGEASDGEGARLAATTRTSPAEARRFSASYEVEIPARAASSGAMQLFLPIAIDTAAQRIEAVEVESEFAGSFAFERIYGNRYWRAEIPATHVAPLSIRVKYQVERRVLHAGDEPGDAETAELFLESNARVVVDHPILQPILADVRAMSSGGSKADRARAIYDWVVDHVEYKKVGTGWGNGDTFWACTERYGNCTDFHSLFISLARTEEIPARFEMGFPIPTDREEGMVLGYHCWVEFWLPERGWFPIDASEAFKHPEQRELFYGRHPADRLHFTTGRDLRLGPEHKDRPLNYFIYPYVEIDGKRSDVAIKTRLHFQNRQDPAAS